MPKKVAAKKGSNKAASDTRGVSKAVVDELQRSKGDVSHADKPSRASGRRAARIANKMARRSSSTSPDKSSARNRSTGSGKKKRSS